MHFEAFYTLTITIADTIATTIIISISMTISISSTITINEEEVSVAVEIAAAAAKGSKSCFVEFVKYFKLLKDASKCYNIGLYMSYLLITFLNHAKSC